MLYDSGMINGTKPIPVRLTPAMIERLDRAAQAMGLENRTALIKICLRLFMDALEKANYKLPGIDLDSLIKDQDGRTWRYSDKKKGNGK